MGDRVDEEKYSELIEAMDVKELLREFQVNLDEFTRYVDIGEKLLTTEMKDNFNKYRKRLMAVCDRLDMDRTVQVAFVEKYYSHLPEGYIGSIYDAAIELTDILTVDVLLRGVNIGIRYVITTCDDAIINTDPGYMFK